MPSFIVQSAKKIVGLDFEKLKVYFRERHTYRHTYRGRSIGGPKEERDAHRKNCPPLPEKSVHLVPHNSRTVDGQESS